jgi:hypothetical protein
MNTHEKNGTGANALMQGTKTFLDQRDMRNHVIKFQGWRRHWGEFRTGVDCPQLSWIKRTLSNGGTVWLNIGWYRRGEDQNEYRRISGHWVTAVGYGRDPEGKANPNILIIHDPAPRAGTKSSQEFVLMTILEDGKLTGTARNLPRRARGLYLMSGGLRLKRGAQFAILDGAVSLTLTPNPPPPK